MRRNEEERYHRLVDFELEAQRQPDDSGAAKVMSALMDGRWSGEPSR